MDFLEHESPEESGSPGEERVFSLEDVESLLERMPDDASIDALMEGREKELLTSPSLPGEEPSPAREARELDLVSSILDTIEEEIVAEVREELSTSLPGPAEPLELDTIDRILQELPEAIETEDLVAPEPFFAFPERPDPTLPLSYDEDLLVILIRDPYKAFAYWDFSNEKRETLGIVRGDDESPGGQLYLKIYKGLEKNDLFRDPQLHLEIPILPGISSCYFELDEAFNAYYGTIEFVPFFDEPRKVSSSNVISPPKASMSDEYDQEWKAIEKIYQRFYSLVKKELQAETRMKEMIAAEEIEEIIAAEGLEEMEELREIAREEGLTTAEIAEKVETWKTEKIQERLQEKLREKAEQERKELEFLESPPVEEQRQRRQEILQRLVTAYLEKRALPGGMYAPNLPGTRQRGRHTGQGPAETYIP